MKCGGYDLNTVIMSIEEACRFDKDVYDCVNWILMKCRKIYELWRNDDLQHDNLYMIYAHANMMNNDGLVIDMHMLNCLIR